MKRRAAFSLFLIQLLIPSVVYAGVVFTEIMYDFPGTEGSGEHDWVEISNSGPQPVDLTTYKFFEANTNHGLKLERGDAVLQPGSFAVISNSTPTFLADWPNFSGALFDSSFNLNSSGEPLKLCSNSCSAEGSVTEDSFTYAPVDSATNNGNSIQKNSSGNWIAALPAPGMATLVLDSQTQNTNQFSSPEPLSAPAQSSGGSNWPVEPQVFADAGKDKIVVVGAGVIFEGKAYGLKKEPLENARFLWSFGDGAMKEGKIVEHAYRYPGDYLVVLDVGSGYFSGSDQLKVKAENSPISISRVTDGKDYFVELYNSSNSNIDLGGWWLALDLPAATGTAQAGNKNFEIPKNTFVMGGKRLIFPNEVTGLLVGEGSVPELRYPNGTLAHRFGETKAVAKLVQSENTSTRKSVEPSVLVPKNETPTAPLEVNQEEEENMATPALAVKDTGLNYIWLLGVLGVSAVALVGVFFTRRLERPEDNLEKIAREIEIIEG